VRGETATTRSDIFALGALLYLLLSGERPWPETKLLHQLEHSICEDDPAPPSRRVTGTTRTRIAGDLDAIVLQCLAKRPEQRYASVAELCDDLRRHLDGLPIRARRIGPLTRALRLSRRRPVVPIATSLALVALVAGWRAWDSEQRVESAVSQRAATERRIESSHEELKTAISDRIATANRHWADGRFDAAQAELDAALNAIAELPDELELRARIIAQRAGFANIERQPERCLELVEQAEQLLSEVETPNPRTVATLLNLRSHVLKRSGSADESRAASQAALEHAQTHLAATDELRVDAVLDWAEWLRGAGFADDSLLTLEEAADAVRDLGEESEMLARILNEQAVTLAALERYETAVDCYREAIEVLGVLHGERHPSFASLRFNLGRTLHGMERTSEAVAEFERSLATSRYFELDYVSAANQHFLALIHLERGDFERSVAAAREAFELRTRFGDELLRDTSACLLGLALANQGADAEAIHVLEPLLTGANATRFRGNLEAKARHALGLLLNDAGEHARARPHLERALELKLEQHGPTHADCVALHQLLNG